MSLIVSCGHGGGAYACENCKQEAIRNLTEQERRKILQGLLDYENRKISIREWRKPSIWKKIKGMFR